MALPFRLLLAPMSRCLTESVFLLHARVASLAAQENREKSRPGLVAHPTMTLTICLRGTPDSHAARRHYSPACALHSSDSGYRFCVVSPPRRSSSRNVAILWPPKVRSFAGTGSSRLSY